MKDQLNHVRNSDYAEFEKSMQSHLRDKMRQNEVIQDYIEKISSIQRKIDLYKEIKNS